MSLDLSMGGKEQGSKEGGVERPKVLEMFYRREKEKTSANQETETG